MSNYRTTAHLLSVLAIAIGIVSTTSLDAQHESASRYGRSTGELVKVVREATERVMVAITLLLEGIRGGTAPAVRFDPRRAAAAAGAPIATDDDAVVGPASPAPEEDRPASSAQDRSGSVDRASNSRIAWISNPSSRA